MTRTFVLWLLAGLAVGTLATIVVLRWQFADPVPEIAPADFYSARDLWKSKEPPNYDIEVQVIGTRGAKYRVEVRDGIATAAWLNGLPLQQQRTFGTWSVPGMFGTMSRDIEAVERRAADRAEQATPRLTLRAAFDPQFGYPARYRRIEWGSNVQASWEVTKFEVVGNGQWAVGSRQ